MSQRKTVHDNIGYNFLDDYNNCTLKDVRTQINELILKHGEDTFITLHDSHVELHVSRLETDAEMVLRIQREGEANLRLHEKKMEQYLRLKAELGL